jgi:Asparagine synthase/Glutamine amidotransferase domain
MTNRKMAFLGAMGEAAQSQSASLQNRTCDLTEVWRSRKERVSLSTTGETALWSCSWNSFDENGSQPAIFIWGRPSIASDTEFAAETQIYKPTLAELAPCIARLYMSYGTKMFALLEGNYSLVVFDRNSRCAYLAVDKFGCDDIYYRADRNSLAFASDIAPLHDGEAKFDARTAAFFLAQEGFVPAPYTLFEGIKSIGRARFMRARFEDGKLLLDIEKYWQPAQSWNLATRKATVDKFCPLLEKAVEESLAPRSGILLSGGIDSTLLVNLAASHRKQRLIAITGAIKGQVEGESELALARKVAASMNVPHEAVVLDPDDESLPEEWQICTESWMNGARITLPLFYRFALVAKERLGADYSVLSGQMADTLADNNYTFPSAGYFFRRAFYSPWFLTSLHALRKCLPSASSRGGKAILWALQKGFGPRARKMLESVLDGLSSKQRFYEGRLFGYGEMPGRSASYFPVLTPKGFEHVADWYSANFIQPICSHLTPATFYRDMIGMSLDMVMLHLDTRLVFHAFRLGQGKAELPFLDARVVNFFASMPYSARALYREPKNVIRAQLRERTHKTLESMKTGNQGAGPLTDEMLLARGTLGSYFRELLAQPHLFESFSEVFELVDESYVTSHVRAFREGKHNVDYKLISRIAALELWHRTLAEKSPVMRSCALAC